MDDGDVINDEDSDTYVLASFDIIEVPCYSICNCDGDGVDQQAHALPTVV